MPPKTVWSRYGCASQRSAHSLHTTGFGAVNQTIAWNIPLTPGIVQEVLAVRFATKRTQAPPGNRSSSWDGWADGPHDAGHCHDQTVRAEQLTETIRPLVEAGEVPGAVVGVLHNGEVSVEAVGRCEPGGGVAMPVDALMRISSNTKPMVAAATLLLAQKGILALDDTVERFVPELTDRQVLRRLDGRLDDTVPAHRSITIEYLLTMRMGFGFVFESKCPAVDAAAAAGLGHRILRRPRLPTNGWLASRHCPCSNNRARYGATSSPSRCWESCSPGRLGALLTLCCAIGCSNRSA